MRKEKMHNLKIKEEYFYLQVENKKNWEIRKNDRDFKEGDYIKLILVDKDGHETTSHLYLKIDYVYTGTDYGLKEGYCILSTHRLP